MDGQIHSLLRRQLKRCFESLDHVSPEVRAFIEAVDAAYRQSDSDRLMLERSFELTSLELNQANTNLRAAVLALHEAQKDLEARVHARTRDLAERDEQLRHVQKMESIGRLAGGVAHDFNNLLTVIFGNTDLMLSSTLDADDRLAAEQIRKAAESAASLTRQLLAFSRQQFMTPKVIDLNELVSSLEQLLVRLIGEDIEIVTDLQRQHTCLIRADPGQIQQVVLNLVVNARDAMPEGGRITISTSSRTVADGSAPVEGAAVRPGEYVSLDVADTGTGMKPDVRARVFEPFFTTKELGRGTGLGLATVYGIVQQSGGYIDLTSEEGVGTTFRVLFPREEVLAEVAVEDRRQEGGSAGVILIAEDQEGVRTLARDWLRRRGYTVVEAKDGLDALEKFQALPRLDLLLTDVVMPRMNGKVLAARMAESRPGLKILYMTGYIDDADLVRVLRDSHVPVLQKPFSADGLLRMVRETLESVS